MIDNTNTKNITDFLNKEYLDYSISTVSERAIPSLCDGFKPGARKIMHAANEGTIKDGRTYKLLVLSGDTMNKSQYAHGDASLNGTIAEKSKDFVNNLNALEIEGQSGSLRNPDAVGSPRYLYIRKSKYMDMVYKTDYDLLEYVFDEGMFLEPKQYMPIIPTVLTSLAMGIANGYSFHSMAYNPLNVIDVCSELIKDGQHSTMLCPYLRGVKKDSWRYIDGKWWSYGSWKINQSKDLLTIEDLPYDVTYEDFENLLIKMQEKNNIKDWKNLSQDGNVHYEITFYPKQLSAEVHKDSTTMSLASKFKLVKQVPDDLLWVLDENNKLKYFANAYELSKYFVNWRLGIYGLRKKRLVKILEERYDTNSQLVKFIENVCNGTLKIRNRNKADIKVDMDVLKLPMTLLATPMSKCTVEERDELLKQNEDIKNELEYIKRTSEKDMYLNDLKELRSKLEKDFPEMQPKGTHPIDVEIIGEAKKTKEDRELEKAKREKVKEKKDKEKAKVQKEKEKKLKDREKAKKEKEKEAAAKMKLKEKKTKLSAAILKAKDTLSKLNTQMEKAKLQKNKDKQTELKQKILETKAKINELKESIKSL